MSIEISIIVPCYNAGHVVGKCIEALQKSTFKNYEIICVDDCSTDNTVEIIEGYADVKCVKLKKNGGAAVTRNEGVKAAKGEYFLFIDSDIIVYEDTLQKFYENFKADRGDVIVSLYSKEHPFKGVVTNYKNLHLHYTHYILPSDVKSFDTSCVAIKRKVFEDVGGLNPDIVILAGEDWDLSTRIVNKGYRLYQDHTLQVVHAKNYSFRKFLATDLRKAFGLSKLVFRYKQGIRVDKKRIGSIPNNMIFSGFLALVILASGILSFFSPPIGLPALGLSFLLYLLLNRKYLSFFLKEKGLLFMLSSSFLYFLFLILIPIGGGAAFIDYTLLGHKY